MRQRTLLHFGIAHWLVTVRTIFSFLSAGVLAGMNSATASVPIAQTFKERTTPIVFVVDDDVSVRESLELLIGSAGWQAETFSSAADFLSRPRTVAPSCLVLDVSLPDLNGLELQERIADRVDMPIIFITGHGDVAMTVRAMKAGAADFLTKPFRDDVILTAIEDAIHRSQSTLSIEEALQVLRASHASLSRRERDVMKRVVAGMLNKQVGGQLGISEITVKAHRGQVMRKMGAGSLPGLVRMAAALDRDSDTMVQ